MQEMQTILQTEMSQSICSEAEVANTAPEGEAVAETTAPEGAPASDLANAVPEGEAVAETTAPESAPASDPANAVPEGEAVAETTAPEGAPASDLANAVPEGEAVATAEPKDKGQSASDPAELLREITELKRRLDRAEGERTRIANEIAELRTLYPDLSPDALSPAVWEQFSRGVPLAASYALEQRYRARLEELARATDARNRAEASPPISRAAHTDFYSPDEVRAMSGSEVHTHYAAILESMKHWGA